MAAPATASSVNLTSAQLKDAGFPKRANTAGWGGTATLERHRAPQWQDVIVQGQAASFVPVGQVLTLERFVPSDTRGSGEFKELNITTTVQANRSFVLHFQLGLVGTYGYRVGYETTSESPENIAFQFQFTTTGDPNGNATVGKDSTVRLTSKQLAAAGFTKQANTVGWGAPATLSSHVVQRGQPVTVAGDAPEGTQARQQLQLMRFVATDRLGSGHFEPTGITTRIGQNGKFTLTFEPADAGLFGYSLGYPTAFEWIGIEFQVRVR